MQWAYINFALLDLRMVEDWKEGLKAGLQIYIIITYLYIYGSNQPSTKFFISECIQIKVRYHPLTCLFWSCCPNYWCLEKSVEAFLTDFPPIILKTH